MPHVAGIFSGVSVGLSLAQTLSRHFPKEVPGSSAHLREGRRCFCEGRAVDSSQILSEQTSGAKSGWDPLSAATDQSGCPPRGPPAAPRENEPLLAHARPRPSSNASGRCSALRDRLTLSSLPREP